MPHTFYLGDDIAAMIRYAEPVLAQVHVADVLNHRASSGLRYIVNPPGSTARVHQHLDIGQGEVDFEAGFGALRAIGFDGIVTSCVFAWEERAVESSRLMFERITALLERPAERLTLDSVRPRRRRRCGRRRRGRAGRPWR